MSNLDQTEQQAWRAGARQVVSDLRDVAASFSNVLAPVRVPLTRGGLFRTRQLTDPVFILSAHKHTPGQGTPRMRNVSRRDDLGPTVHGADGVLLTPQGELLAYRPHLTYAGKHVLDGHATPIDLVGAISARGSIGTPIGELGVDSSTGQAGILDVEFRQSDGMRAEYVTSILDWANARRQTVYDNHSSY
jgi:hypothetical protein